MPEQATDARRISEIRNLGPACEQDLNAMGVFSAEDLKRLGPEDVFVQMLEGRIKLGRSDNSYSSRVGLRCSDARKTSVFQADPNNDVIRLP